MKSSLIEIAVGNLVKEIDSERVGVVRDIKLTPNGVNDPQLVAILFVEMAGIRGKSIVSATSNKFCPVEYETYAELFQCVHTSKLCDVLKEEQSPGL